MRFIETSIRCPACSAKFPLREGMIDHEVAALGELISAFGPDWRALQPYLSCFRTAQGRAIRPERMLLILEELAAIWRTKTYTLNKKTMTVSSGVLRAALGEMAAKSDTMTGLKNHNYFKKILENMMQKMNAEQSKIERLEISRDKSGAGRQDEPSMSPEVAAEIERARLEREAKLPPEERAALLRKNPPRSPFGKGGGNTVDRQAAETLVREELRTAGWPEEKIDNELNRRRLK